MSDKRTEELLSIFNGAWNWQYPEYMHTDIEMDIHAEKMRLAKAEIRQRIEHGPEVDEETLESLLGERSLYGIIRYLRQKGVTVKEAQNQNEIYQDEGPGLQEEGDK